MASAGVLRDLWRGGRGVRLHLPGVAAHPPQCGPHRWTNLWNIKHHWHWGKAEEFRPKEREILGLIIRQIKLYFLPLHISLKILKIEDIFLKNRIFCWRKHYQGRMMVSGAYYICLQYGSEIFPTVIRGQGVALTEIVGGVAIFTSPLVVYLVS